VVNTNKRLFRDWVDTKSLELVLFQNLLYNDAGSDVPKVALLTEKLFGLRQRKWFFLPELMTNFGSDELSPSY